MMRARVHLEVSIAPFWVFYDYMLRWGTFLFLLSLALGAGFFHIG